MGTTNGPYLYYCAVPRGSLHLLPDRYIGAGAYISIWQENLGGRPARHPGENGKKTNRIGPAQCRDPPL